MKLNEHEVAVVHTVLMNHVTDIYQTYREEDILKDPVLKYDFTQTNEIIDQIETHERIPKISWAPYENARQWYKDTISTNGTRGILQ